MSVQHVSGTPDQFKLEIDFDLQANDDSSWTLVAQTPLAQDWVVRRFKMMAHPTLDVEGTALVIEMIQRDELLVSIDGELRHG